MTEERIEELADKYGMDVYIYARDLDAYQKLMAKLIRTVAAEAREADRKEGIDELLNAAEQVVSQFRVEGHGDLRSVIACIRGEAERLKEKGK